METKEKHPFVSVVMPIYNEGEYIRRSLDAVLNQDYPADEIEIILADGMSTDQTRNILKEYQHLHSNIRVIDNPYKFVAFGLNEAIRQSRGEIIVRVDGHCEIAPDYVRQSIKLLESRKWDAVGGLIETIGETAIAQAIAVAMSSWFGVGGTAFRTIREGERETDTVPFPAYHKEIFSKIGYFDEELVRNQDDEHNYRIRKNGGKVFLSSKIRSRYYSRGTLPALWSQYLQYGYWKVRVMQKHAAQMSLRQFVPVGFIFLLAASLLLSLFFKSAFFLFLSCVAVYFTANLSVSVYQFIKFRNVALISLPVIYAALHFSYGIGFIKGLMKFRNRWKI